MPQSAQGQSEPQPLTHLGVPNANLYRNLLRTFARVCLGLPGDTRMALGRTLAACGEVGKASSSRC